MRRKRSKRRTWLCGGGDGVGGGGVRVGGGGGVEASDVGVDSSGNIADYCKTLFTPILPGRDGESKYVLMQCVLSMIGIILM